MACATVSKACPSTGWVTGVLNVHQAAICQWEPSVQDEVFATGPDTVICSSGSPVMKAKLVDGGMVVSGRGRWSSGCEHAEWAMVGAKVPDVSDKQFPERNYRPFLFMVHRSQYEIDDTWHAACMSGSGSHDLVFDNLFVPTRRAEEVIGMNFNRGRGAGSVDNWISRIPFSLLFSIFFPAVALGCADGMVEEYTNRQRSRKSVMTGAQGIVNAASHMRLAESVHELESLTAYYRQLLDSMQEFGTSEEPLTEGKFNSMLHSASVRHEQSARHRRTPLRSGGSERDPHLEPDAAVLARCARVPLALRPGLRRQPTATRPEPDRPGTDARISSPPSKDRLQTIGGEQNEATIKDRRRRDHLAPVIVVIVGDWTDGGCRVRRRQQLELGHQRGADFGVRARHRVGQRARRRPRPRSGEPIKLMTIGPVEAPGFSIPSIPVGAQTAIDEINAAGGINGHQVELITCNDQNDPNVAAQCGKQAVDEGVVALVGGLSLFDLNILPALQQAGIPWVGLTSSDSFDQAGVYLFGGDGASAFTGIGGALAKEGCKNVAILLSAIGRAGERAHRSKPGSSPGAQRSPRR